jgi:acyl-coenzyme A thioesterase PaaI-like protein
MKICTHKKIDRRLCGELINIKPGYSKVQLLASADMAVDDFGLIHGGFVFGLADYAAMIAVNDPNVVLGAAEVKFLKPVKVGQSLLAEAVVANESGKKRLVKVVVKGGDDNILEGTFSCFVLDQHVLS